MSDGGTNVGEHFKDDIVIDERMPKYEDGEDGPDGPRLVCFEELPAQINPSLEKETTSNKQWSVTDSYQMGQGYWDNSDIAATDLIDNEFANVMLSDEEGGNHALRAEWLRVLQSEYDKNQELADRPSLRSRISGRVSKVGEYAMAATGSMESTSSRKSRAESRKQSMIESTMMVGGLGGRMKPHHVALTRVIKTIFGTDDLSKTIKASSSETSNLTIDDKSEKTLMGRLKRLQRLALRLVLSTAFTLLSFVLTFYALLAPDLVALLGSKEQDNFFLSLNTVIFFLFIVELLIMILAHSNAPQEYVLSLPFVLDILAIVGFLSDTWLLQVNNSGSGNYGNATRMARLPRLARIARATRLIPRLIALFRRDQSSFAAMIMLRRLRRAFMVMDVDGTGYLSIFDLRCLYVCLLTECGEMLRTNKIQLLMTDKEMLKGDNVKKIKAARAVDMPVDDSEKTLRFSDFTAIIIQTELGKDLLRFHTREVLNSKGIFTLTTKLSDTASLRICMGILVISVCTKMLDLEVPQISIPQGLMQMHRISMREHAASVVNFTAVCETVDTFTQDYDVLFLYLDGRIYVDIGRDAMNKCLTPVLTAFSNATGAMEAALQQSGLRESEVVKACWPEVDECPEDGAASFALVDTENNMKETVMWSMISTLTVVVIIILFILFFKREIARFTKRTLRPLRKLVDDMIAISCLELVDIDPDKEAEPTDLRWSKTSSLMIAIGAKKTLTRWLFGKRPLKVNKEIAQLQKSFKSMQNAIRSWSRYVPPSVVQKLFSAGVEATVGVSKVPCTILFVDVIGFEDAVKGMNPKEVNETLANMLATVAAAVQKNDGTLLEFIGDEVLAVFNTPTVTRAHVLAALTTALEIHRDIAKLAPLLRPDHSAVQLRCRCGVHTARVLAGNIGSHRRMKYGLLGDGVNLSARLKSINSRYGTQTLASDQVVKDEPAARRIVFRPVDFVILKGKTEPTTLYEVLGFQRCQKGDDEERNKTLVETAENHAEAFRLYYNRDFVNAKAKFHQVSATLRAIKHCTVVMNERDMPSFEMRRRCKKYIRNPPDESWDGVEKLTAKSYAVTSEDLSDSEAEPKEAEPKEQQAVPLDTYCDLDYKENTAVSV